MNNKLIQSGLNASANTWSAQNNQLQSSMTNNNQLASSMQNNNQLASGMQNNNQSATHESDKPAAWSTATAQPGAQVCCFVIVKEINLNTLTKMGSLNIFVYVYFGLNMLTII